MNCLLLTYYWQVLHVTFFEQSMKGLIFSLASLSFYPKSQAESHSSDYPRNPPVPEPSMGIWHTGENFRRVDSLMVPDSQVSFRFGFCHNFTFTLLAFRVRLWALCMGQRLHLLLFNSSFVYKGTNLYRFSRSSKHQKLIIQHVKEA